MRALGWLLVLGAVGGGIALGASFPLAAQDDQRERGKVIFVERCAKCHGEQGEGKLGRALIGPTANLGGYGTARGLFDYTRKIMPIDAPGRLLESEYWAVLAYILNQNKLLPDGTTLGRQNAAGVRLTQ
jgi:S-disulfanyl-L-cysteine oxidoreductase SoxD